MNALDSSFYPQNFAYLIPYLYCHTMLVKEHFTIYIETLNNNILYSTILLLILVGKEIIRNMNKGF